MNVYQEMIDAMETGKLEVAVGGNPYFIDKIDAGNTIHAALAIASAVHEKIEAVNRPEQCSSNGQKCGLDVDHDAQASETLAP